MTTRPDLLMAIPVLEPDEHFVTRLADLSRPLQLRRRRSVPTYLLTGGSVAAVSILGWLSGAVPGTDSPFDGEPAKQPVPPSLTPSPTPEPTGTGEEPSSEPDVTGDPGPNRPGQGRAHPNGNQATAGNQSNGPGNGQGKGNRQANGHGTGPSTGQGNGPPNGPPAGPRS